MIDHLETLSAAAIGRLIAAGTLDPVAVTEFFLERIAAARHNPAFILVTAERAKREAQASARRHREGRPASALDGVPVAWKDLYDMAGAPTTAASAILRDSPPKERDCPALANMTAAGTVALGKTNLSEFAFSGLGLNPHFGTPVNPHDLGTPRIPGGSSSGTAVAIAAGLAPCGTGSDTGGSIRVPASFTGIVGFKTTEGRIDKTGVFALSQTLDTMGPMARTVEDCVLMDMAMRGAVTTPVHRADLAGLRVIAHTDVVVDGIDDAVAANYGTVLARLSAAGAKIEERSLELVAAARALNAQHGPQVSIEAYYELRPYVESDAVSRMDRRVAARARLGKERSAYDLLVYQRERERLIAVLEAEIGDALVVTPATPMTAPAIAPLDESDDLFRAVNLRALHFAFIGNFFRMCGLALPSGRDAGGMPTGVQFLAKGGSDDRLLSLGLAIERVLAEE